jgi:hypothetical protein
MKMPGGSHRPGTSRAPVRPARRLLAYLLLLREDLLPELALRLPERLPPLALARSLWARLFWVLALPPLLAACARLDFPEEDDDLEEPEDEELRDAIACSFGWMHQRPHMTSGGHLLTLGRPCADPVGLPSGSA